MTHTQTWVNKTLKSWNTSTGSRCSNRNQQSIENISATSSILYSISPCKVIWSNRVAWYQAEFSTHFTLFPSSGRVGRFRLNFFSHISHILHSSMKQKQTHKMLTANSISLKKKINTLKANKLHQNVSTKVSVSILCYFTLLRGKATFYPTTYNLGLLNTLKFYAHLWT